MIHHNFRRDSYILQHDLSLYLCIILAHSESCATFTLNASNIARNVRILVRSFKLYKFLLGACVRAYSRRYARSRLLAKHTQCANDNVCVCVQCSMETDVIPIYLMIHASPNHINLLALSHYY